MLIFTTGFDYYEGAQVTRVWPYSSGGESTVPGRFGGCGWGWNNANGFLSSPITASTTVIIGLAFTVAFGDATNPFLLFQDGTTSQTSPITQVDIRVTEDAAFQATLNGTILGTTLSNLFPFGFWNYLEVMVTISSTVGVVQINLNGQTVLNLGALNTKYTGNNYVNQFRLQPFASTGAFEFEIDDLYVCNNAGSVNNSFLGECRVQTQYPTANGEENDFVVVGAALNYEAVDETFSDDDATYVKSSVVGNIDDYEMGTVAFTGSVFGVQVNVTQRKDDVGFRTIAPMINSGGTVYEGPSVNCQSDYTVSQGLWETNPNTSAAWSNTTINDLTAGIKITG